MTGVLYLVTCGAPLATRIGDGVRTARDYGWRPAVIPTDAARAWIDERTLPDDVPVVTGHRRPGEAKRLPAPDALAVVPATFNTLTGWANGRADSYPLATLCSALGARRPIVAVPFAKHDLAGHPAWAASLAVLRYAGVRLLDPTTGAVDAVNPITSGTGDQVAAAFRWEWVFAHLPMPSPD